MTRDHIQTTGRERRASFAVLAAVSLFLMLRLSVAADDLTRRSGFSDFEEGPVLRLRVVDATNRNPIPGTTVRVSFPLATDLPRREEITNASGECELHLPRPTGTHVSLFAEGYAWSEAAWDSATLPQEHTFALERGSRIGGIVLDQRGNPIPGARVGMIREIGSRFHVDEIHRGHIEVTNSEGRWTCAHAPAQLKTVQFHFFHPQHAAAVVSMASGPSAPGEVLTAEQLLAGSAVILLQQGVPVIGQIVTDEGNPVEGARITGGSYPVWTTADGRFRLAHCPPGPLELTVAAAGFAPTTRRIEVTDTPEKQVVSLRPVPPLRLRVVNWDGEPLAHATVRLIDADAAVSLNWRAETDIQGRVEWRSPPGGSARFEVVRQGYEPSDCVIQTGFEREQTIQLRRPLQVQGDVVDARSGQPVGSFRVIPGRFLEDHHHWEEQHAVPATSGRFQIELRESGQPHAIKIEADGFYPALSHPFAPEAEHLRLRFELEPGTPIRGIVHDPEGKPVRGAEVALAVRAHPVTLGRARFVDHGRGRIVETDDHGRFHIQPVRDAQALFVAHERGFAEARLPSDPIRTLRLALQPWARIEGRLTTGTTPAPQRLLALIRPGIDDLVYHTHAHSTLTDSDGQFSFPLVPSGEHWLVRILQGRPSHAIAITTYPGQQAHIALGRDGRHVIGKVQLEPPIENENWTGHHPASLRRALPPLEPPGFPDDATRQAWEQEWQRTTEGRRRALDEFPYLLSLAPDGWFHVEDVPAGEYILEVHYHEPASTTHGADLCRGMLRISVIIPVAPPDHADAPADLGAIRVPLRPDPVSDVPPP